MPDAAFSSGAPPAPIFAVAPAIAGSAAKSERTTELDGIRGWAALIVLLFHVFWEMLGHVLPQVRNPVTGVFLNGGTAVAIFFILSGDALSAAFFARMDERAVDRLAVKRYFRLTVPILISCLLVFAVIKLGWDYHRAAAKLVHSEDWLGDVLQFQPSVLNLLEYALRDVYLHHTKQQSYNPFLWTMPIEMIGSLLVFLLCYLWDRMRQPCWVLIGATAALYAAAAPYALFGTGMLLGYARRQGVLDRLRDSRSWQLAALLIVALAFMISANFQGNHATALVAGLLVLGFYTQRHLRWFFASTVSRFLGRISFPLYLVHFPVIISLMSWMLLAQADGSREFDAGHLVLIACATIAASLILATALSAAEQALLKRLEPLLVARLR